jgi:hypothetical protein
VYRERPYVFKAARPSEERKTVVRKKTLEKNPRGREKERKREWSKKYRNSKSEVRERRYR